MPTDPCRRDEIAAAVAAHDAANPTARLPRNTTRLLAVMFATEDVCRLSQQALVAEGFGKSLPGVLRALVEAGFVSKAHPGERGLTTTYRLHLPPRQR